MSLGLGGELRLFTAFLTCILVQIGSASASQYYVDFAAGADNTAGTWTAAPWKHSPGDPLAAGTPLSKALQAGDTVNFKGGVTYRGSVAMKWSGAASAPITLDGNFAGSWGTGAA